jgi:uncharacterized protein
MEIAETLRTARRAAGLTQVRLAERTGIGASVISAYEHGARTPSAEAFLRLLDGAGYDLRTVRRLDPVVQSRRLVQVLELAEQLPYRERPLARPRFTRTSPW